MRLHLPHYDEWLGEGSRFSVELAKSMDFPEARAESLVKSMAYSVGAGGKRFRPYLIFAVTTACGGDISYALAPSVAVELVHTYSLIHDDLPAMDDDDMRRGRPSNHKVFGEGMAILAGDALQSRAFEILCSDWPEGCVAPGLRMKLAAGLAEAIGASGMAGGQALDIGGGAENEQGLILMHGMKTGALIEYCCKAGALISDSDCEVASRLGREIGLSFQIMDDILDATSTAQQMGKTPGKDMLQGKSTFASIFGIDSAKRMLSVHLGKAMEAASFFPGEKDAIFAAIEAIRI